MHKFCAEMKIFNDAVNIFRTKLNGIMFAIFFDYKKPDTFNVDFKKGK